MFGPVSHHSRPRSESDGLLRTRTSSMRTSVDAALIMPSGRDASTLLHFWRSLNLANFPLCSPSLEQLNEPICRRDARSRGAHNIWKQGYAIGFLACWEYILQQQERLCILVQVSTHHGLQPCRVVGKILLERKTTINGRRILFQTAIPQISAMADKNRTAGSVWSQALV